jgi:hypothetical protein
VFAFVLVLAFCFDLLGNRFQDGVFLSLVVVFIIGQNSKIEFAFHKLLAQFSVKQFEIDVVPG